MEEERVLKDVEKPPKYRLSGNKFWNNDGLPNINVIIDHQSKEGLMREDDVLTLCAMTRILLLNEPNILTLDQPTTVVGDIHGQYWDLLNVFKVGGDLLEETKYLFLGDYVDRGAWGMECVIHLFSLKLLYPDRVFMIRGNHECRHLSRYFNFEDECLFKYSEEVYKAVMKAFDSLPLGAVLANKFFCVHGGISPETRLIDEINGYDRDGEPPPEGMLCDMMWSDPHHRYDDSEVHFIHNDQRGCSWMYGYNSVVAFLRENNLICMIRGHEAQEKGYRIYKKHPTKQFPSLITIFSAANYIDTYNNKGAVMLYRKGVMKISSYAHSEHPFVLPDFLNAFSWSLPFVVEKSCDFISEIYKNLEEANEGDVNREIVLKRKVAAIGKVARMYSVLTNEKASLDKLKTLIGSEDLPSGLLLAGPDAISDAVKYFEEARIADMANEIRPAWPHSLDHLPIKQTITIKKPVMRRESVTETPVLEVS